MLQEYEKVKLAQSQICCTLRPPESQDEKLCLPSRRSFSWRLGGPLYFACVPCHARACMGWQILVRMRYWLLSPHPIRNLLDHSFPLTHAYKRKGLGTRPSCILLQLLLCVFIIYIGHHHKFLVLLQYTCFL